VVTNAPNVTPAPITVPLVEVSEPQSQLVIAQSLTMKMLTKHVNLALTDVLSVTCTPTPVLLVQMSEKEPQNVPVHQELMMMVPTQNVKLVLLNVLNVTLLDVPNVVVTESAQPIVVAHLVPMKTEHAAVQLVDSNALLVIMLMNVLLVQETELPNHIVIAQSDITPMDKMLIVQFVVTNVVNVLMETAVLSVKILELVPQIVHVMVDISNLPNNVYHVLINV